MHILRDNLPTSDVSASIFMMSVMSYSFPSANHMLYEGGRNKSGLLARAQNMNIFRKLFVLFFQNIPTNVYTLLPSFWELLVSLCKHEVDLLLRYRLTADIKGSTLATIVGVTSSAGLPGLGLSLRLNVYFR